MKPQAELKVVMVPTDDLVMYEGNAKLHPHEQVDQIAASIEEFNFADPIAAWHNEDGESIIIEGHGRLMAARKLGIESLPVIYLDYLTDEQRRAYTLAHNKLTMNSGYDFDILLKELENITSIEMAEFGFDIQEFDFRWDDIEGISAENYEEPERDFLRCPKCGTVDLRVHFVQAKNENISK